MVVSIDSADRRARIEQMIEEYRELKRRALLRRAIRLWRRAEADQRLAEFEASPERIH